MKTAYELTQEIRARHNLRSDAQVAKALGLTRSAVSNMKRLNSALDDDTAVRAAQLLGYPVEQVLLWMQLQRTKNAAARSAWEKIARGFRAAAFAVVVLGATLTPYPAAEAAQSAQKAPHWILCQVRRLRRFLRLWRLSLALTGFFALTPAQADPYVIAGAGIAYFTPGADGLWWQSTYPHRLDLTGAFVELGAGIARGRWRYEATAQLLDGGSFVAEWESDDVFYSPARGSGPITGFGTSHWRYYGVHVRAAYQLRPRVALSLGYAGLVGWWRTDHVDLFDNVGSRHAWIVEHNRATPTLGASFRLSEQLSIDLTHYVNIAMRRGAGVDTATTLALVGRF